jgi:hypothetical protein
MSEPTPMRCDHAAGAEDASCEACRLRARARSIAADVWRDDVGQEDAARRETAERELLARWPPPPRRLPAQLATGLAVGAVLLVALDLGLRGAAPKSAATTATAAASTSTTGRGESAAVRAPGPAMSAAPEPASQARPSATAVVAVAGCARCTWQAPVAPGATLGAGERVDVPRGERLLMGWAVEQGLVDPAEGIEVTGPAQVRIEPQGPVVTQGQARARTRSERSLAGVFATLRGADAEWTLEQRADRMRVAVVRGEVWLAHAGDAQVRLASGDAVDVLPDGCVVGPGEAPPRIAAASAPPSGRPRAPSEPAPAASVAAAAPDPAANSAADARARDRASFLEAELELKAGHSEGARERLEALLRSSDAPLAGDAAFLLARSASGPAERADVLARYLRTDPPEPYRAQATAERAAALCEAGNVAEARELLDAAGASPSPDVAGRTLAIARACVARAR